MIFKIAIYRYRVMAEINELQGMLDKIRQDFINELPSKVEYIEELTLKSVDADTFHELYRNVHSLKGNGGTLGLPIITSICHQYENYLNRYADKVLDDNFVQSSLTYIDLLNELQVILQAGKDHDLSSIEDKLKSLHENEASEKKTVLISVSSPLELIILQELLPDDRYFITVAQNGMDALEYLMINQYDLLITNLETTPLNGIALITAVKNNGRKNKDITSILLTSKDITPDCRDIPSVVIKKDTDLQGNLALYLSEL